MTATGDHTRDRTDDAAQLRTASASALTPWLAELGRSLAGIAPSLGFPPVLDMRTRLRLHVHVADAAGSTWSVWVHDSLAQFLGETGYPDADEALLAYAVNSTAAGAPSDPSSLLEVLPAGAVTVARAAVARMEISSLFVNSAQSFVDRLSGRRPRNPVRMVTEGLTGLVAVPVLVPLAGLALAVRGLTAAAPPMPEVNTPPGDEANLLVGLIAQAMPAYLANAAVRTVVLRSPVMLVVGVRSGHSTATVRLGRGIVAVDNGIAPAAQIVIDGDAGPLLRHASGLIARDLTGFGARPRRS